MKNKVIHRIIPLCALSILSCQQGDHTTNRDASDSTESPAREQLREEAAASIVFERTRVQGQKDTLSFEVPHACTAKMAIQTEGQSSNIRINQLIMPDGQRDGPFGQTVTDSLTQTGTYQLVIAESMMAENPYSGPYTVKIELK